MTVFWAQKKDASPVVYILSQTVGCSKLSTTVSRSRATHSALTVAAASWVRARRNAVNRQRQQQRRQRQRQQRGRRQHSKHSADMRANHGSRSGLCSPQTASDQHSPIPVEVIENLVG
eukprot:COSAG02_NODE_23_length_52893_cov_58.101868_34_plen_118_part_00